MTQRSGKCLCGAVTFTVAGEMTETDACHCSMCRRQNAGSAFIGVHFSDGVTLQNTKGLGLYKGSDWGERGFCKECGTTLFWRLQGEEKDFAIAAGSLDDLSGIKLDAHIFTDEAPAYYTVPTDAPHKTGAQVIKEFEEKMT